MKFNRDDKITRLRLESITVKVKNPKAERCNEFSLNGIDFIANKSFEREIELFDYLLTGKEIGASHVFEDDIINPEEIKIYNLWIEGDYVMIIQLF